MIYFSFYLFQIFNLFSLRCKMCDNILDQYNFRNPDSLFVIHLTWAHRLIKNSVLINEHIRLFAGQCKSLLIGEVFNNILLLICFRCPKSTAIIKCINLRNHSLHIIWTIFYRPFLAPSKCCIKYIYAGHMQTWVSSFRNFSRKDSAFMFYYNISAYRFNQWDINEISPFGPRYQAGLEKGSP